jgi:hypothetical protein
MRRTRGEIGLRFLAVAWAGGVFLAGGWVPGAVADFVGEDLCGAGFGAA